MGCRQAIPAAELVRVRSVDGRLVTGAGGGRGAWIGPAAECIELAAQRQALRRALRAEVNAAEIARLLASWSTELSACPHSNN